VNRFHALALALALLAGAPARAGDTAGSFDYWLLALTWSPQFCSQHTTEPQCLRGEYSFVVHGLWPQYEKGYPDYCGPTKALDRELVERMLPLVHGEKLINDEWRKHGTCSGLAPEEYFRTLERARRAVAIPPEYDDPDQYVKTSAREVTERFVALNPGLFPEAFALECTGRWLKEARICFDRDFKFRACGEDVAGNCREQVVLRPNRLAH
jgi:ribonuclease T2